MRVGLDDCTAKHCQDAGRGDPDGGTLISYVNGDYVEDDEAKISVFDRGFVIGDGVYDSARTFGGNVFKLDEHLDRLARSLRYIEIDADRWGAEIRAATEEVVARNLEEIVSVGDVWVIQIVTRGLLEDAGETAFGLEDEHQPRYRPTIVVIVRPLNFKAFGLLYEEGVDLGVSLLTRAMTGPLDPRVKSTGKLAYSRAERKAARMSSAHALGAKAWTALFHDDGSFSEASGANICAVVGDRILRPPRHYALEGISLETLCELGEAQGLTVEERPLTFYDLVNADETMITSTSFCALPVVSIDGIALPGGNDVYRRTLELWRELVQFDFVQQAEDIARGHASGTVSTQ